jgi:hypothetical protein
VIEDCWMSSTTKAQQKLFSEKDSHLIIKVRYKASSKVQAPIFGITINDGAGQQVFASNTKWLNIAVSDMGPDTAENVTWSVPNIFNTGTYTVSPAVSNTAGNIIYDWHDELLSFKIRKKLESTALVNMPHTISIEDHELIHAN